MQLLTADRPLVTSAGTHVVQLSQIREAVYQVETLAGGSVAQRVDELTVSVADESLARAIARVITVALRREGATVATARRAVCQHLDGQLAFLLDNPSIQATNAAAYLQMVKGMFESPEDKQWADELAADMVAFHRALNGTATGDNHSNPSNDTAGTPSADAHSMADTVPTGHHRQVRPTMAGAQHAPLTDAQRYALATAAQFDGVMLRGKYKPVHLLRALARKGFVTLNYRPGSRRPDPISATLTARGWREAVASR
jgi:hypothetical protein